MKIVETYTARIFAGRLHSKTGVIHPKQEITKVLQDYVDHYGYCVSLKDTDFIYTGGSEPGVEITLINYPRFPESKDELETHAIQIAVILREKLEQKRISIVFPDKTLMLGE